MGKRIVYCAGCSKRLEEGAFSRGKARILENLPYCVACRPPDPLPASPPPAAMPKPQPPPSARPQTTRRMTPRSDKGRSGKRLWAGGAVAALALAALIFAVLFSGDKSPKTEETSPVDRSALAPPGDRSARPANVLRSIERYSSSSRDPDEILRRCAKARALLRGTSGEQALDLIELRAREMKRIQEDNERLNRLLGEIGDLRTDDPGLSRRGEVMALLREALKIAGPRKGEVESLKADYQKELERTRSRAANTMKELERLASSSEDADEILRRCASLRGALRGTRQEKALDRIEERAREMKRRRESERKVAALLEEARKIEADDPAFSRRGKVLALLGAALEIPGPHRAEVRDRRATYEKRSAKAGSANSRNPEVHPPKSPAESEKDASPPPLPAAKADPPRPDAAKVDQGKVDEAIKRGIAYLKTAGSPPHYPDWDKVNIRDSDELLLWTFVHAGVPETDSKFSGLLRKMLESPLRKTYKVALQAMILEELDRVGHQLRILQCAQFLVDNQCRNGQWSYGEPSAAADEIPEELKRKSVSTSGRNRKRYDPALPPHKRPKPKIVRRIGIRRTRTGPDTGDNSNAQYAALGLRACHDAGILIPKETILLAMKSWYDSQLPGDRKLRGYGGIRGWNYWTDDDRDTPAWSSMTAGAVGALIIYDHIVGKKWQRDRRVKAGLNWLSQHFTVTENHDRPEGTRTWYYYYLYALERVGNLYPAQKLGRHEWYPEGVRAILGAQKENGSWDAEADYGHAVWDTCFAILFLQRATRPLEDVASVDRFQQRQPEK